MMTTRMIKRNEKAKNKKSKSKRGSGQKGDTQVRSGKNER